MILLASLLMAAAPADTYSPADLADAQCVAIFAVAAGKASKDATTDPTAMAGIVSGLTYFMGKLRGRTPGIDVEKALRTVIPTLQQNSKPIVDRCTAETKLLADMMDAMGKSLSAGGT